MAEGPAAALGGQADHADRQARKPESLGASSPPSTLGRYVIMSTLGQGGMGVVFKAFDPTLDRRVALKVLHKEIDERHTARLVREAQAMAKLSHPHVVQVYEVGEVDGRTFVAMELVQGQTLRAWMRQQPRPSWRECVEVFLQVGAGLAAAHARGFVHRDFKPGNAMLDDQGWARVLDFGLARQVETIDDGQGEAEERARTDRRESVPQEVALTKTGAVMGTPAYMPAEQMLGRSVDARSDQFSFCVALYEAVYRERPFEGNSVAALMAAVTSNEVRPAPKGRPVPARLRAVLLRGLAVEPEQRWPSMEVLLGQLRRLVAPRRGRWLALGAGVAVGLGLVGAGLAYQADMAQRCTGARAQLDGIWDEERRQAAEAAVLGTEISYAPGTWERVDLRLDAYADAWTDKHTEVCEATSVRGEQSDEAMRLRMRCLDRRRSSLRASVDVLADADAKVVQNAVKLVAGLPALTRCDDLDWLEQQDQRVPPPEDPDLAAEVEALRERLADIEAMDKAGRYAEALEKVEAMWPHAEALEYSPLLAEVRHLQGDLRERNGQYAGSEQDLRRAHALALENHHDEITLGTAQSLAFVVGVRLARYVEGRQWGEMEALPLAQGSGEPTEVAESLSILGSVCLSQGEHEKAQEYYQRALELREKALGPEHPLVAATLDNLGGVYGGRGEYEEAKAYYERAIELWERTLGADHPLVASTLNNLGVVYDLQGKYEKAKAYYRQALEKQERSLGADHPSVANSLSNLGIVYGLQGEYKEAEEHHQRALGAREKALGHEHPDVATSLNNLGNIYMRQGRYGEAREHHERALFIWKKSLGHEHLYVANSLDNLGTLCSHEGKYEEAKKYHERALRIFEEAVGVEHLYVANSLNSLGHVYVRQGEFEAAKEHYERALRIFEEALGSEHPEVANSLLGLATVALERGDPSSARIDAERAVSIRDAAAVAPGWLAVARFVLAQTLWSERSERARARALAEQARDALAAAEGPGDANVDVDEIEAWLAAHRVE
ncbi:MAG: serine/threonine-protein kinase [Myxococcota bacterium]